MIIWANRMYPKNKFFLVGGTEPAMRGMIPPNISEPLRPETADTPQRAEDAHVGAAADLKQGGDLTVVRERAALHHSEVYAPRTVVGNSATHNSRVSTEYGDSEQVQNITYHTAVQVEMKNYNQIHGEQDMVRLAETLSDALYAALQSGGEGVGH